MSVGDNGGEIRVLTLQKGNDILPISIGRGLKHSRAPAHRHDEVPGLAGVVDPFECLVHSDEKGSSIGRLPSDRGPLLPCGSTSENLDGQSQ